MGVRFCAQTTCHPPSPARKIDTNPPPSPASDSPRPESTQITLPWPAQTAPGRTALQAFAEDIIRPRQPRLARDDSPSARYNLSMTFEPDYRHIVDAAANRRPARMPIYEHIIDVSHMERVLETEFADLIDGDEADRREYFRCFCEFHKRVGYDTVSYEVCAGAILPNAGALMSQEPGPIQTRADFEAYPWEELADRFWLLAASRFDILADTLPPGMKIVGGVGNGPFELSEELVGFEPLCYMQADAPDLFALLYERLGELLCTLWRQMLARWGDIIAVPRIGDDMGFKTGTLLAPESLIAHVVPLYSELAAIMRNAGKPFLLHSCGSIFDIMGPMMHAGITAKHSNEDAIAPFEDWITRYGNRIGLFGGVDTDRLCRMAPGEIEEYVDVMAPRYRAAANGFALGSGNSIPNYVPTDSYLAMLRAANRLR